jgi:hypothetical protein
MRRTSLAESRVRAMPFHPVYALSPFILVAWVVALAGVAASTKECGTNERCSTSYGLEWSIVVLEFFVLAATVAVVPTKFCSNCRHLLASLLAIIVPLAMLAAHEKLVTLQRWDDLFEYYEVDAYKRAVKVDAAGAIFVAIINLLLIVYLLLEVNSDSTTAAEVVKTVGSTPQVVQYVPVQQQAAPQVVQYVPNQQAAPQVVHYVPNQQAAPQVVQYVPDHQANPQVVQYVPDQQQATPMVVQYVPDQQQQRPPPVVAQGPSEV